MALFSRLARKPLAPVGQLCALSLARGVKRGQFCPYRGHSVLPAVMRRRAGNPAAVALTPSGEKAQRGSGIEAGIGHQPGCHAVGFAFVAANGHIGASGGDIALPMAEDIVR